jgi:hypothetical protein
MRLYTAGSNASRVFQQGTQFRTKVCVMQKGIFFMPNVNEARIQSGHHSPHLTEIDITDTEVAVGFLIVYFNQLSVFEKGNFHFTGRSVDYHFFFHRAILFIRHEGHGAVSIVQLKNVFVQ